MKWKNHLFQAPKNADEHDNDNHNDDYDHK